LSEGPARRLDSRQRRAWGPGAPGRAIVNVPSTGPGIEGIRRVRAYESRRASRLTFESALVDVNQGGRMAEARGQRDAARRQRAEEEIAPADEAAGPSGRARDVSAHSDEVMADIDRALKEACGFDEDENVNDEQLDERAALLLRNYVQKGGQ
jgi:Pup-like protein